MAKKRRGSRGPYRYTAKRKVALKRAQAISARKRRGKRIKTAVGITSVVAGVGAGAYLGYKYRPGSGNNLGSDVRATGHRIAKAPGRGMAEVRRAVQPGSKEMMRIAHALSPATVPNPNAKKGRGKPTKGAKTMTRTELGKVDPNSVDPERNNAFPKQQRDVDVVNKLMEGSDRPHNVDRFLPRGVKGLIFGKRVTGQAGAKAVSRHAQNKGALTGNDVSKSGILNDMIADGSVTKVYRGKKAKPPRLDKYGMPIDQAFKPKDERVGKFKNRKPVRPT